MAATTDLETTQREGQKAAYPMAAAAHIYAGTLACLDSAGRLVNGAQTANYRFAGIVDEEVDNSSGSAGALDGEVHLGKVWRLTGAGFTLADVGKPVFLVDNETVAVASDGDLTLYIPVGTIVNFVSSTKVDVAIQPGQTSGDKESLLGKARLFQFEVTGVNAAAFNLATVAGYYGGTNLLIERVLSVRSTVTATGADSTVARKVVTTHWTLASGVLTTVGDETANTWAVSCIATLI